MEQLSDEGLRGTGAIGNERMPFVEINRNSGLTFETRISLCKSEVVATWRHLDILLIVWQ